MPQEKITVRGAREHNLKNIDVEIPRDKFVVITGISGSGKSSLAFDTIFAEGQRRYVESLSAYARQFLGQMDKPDVDSIEGLSPAISIDQRRAGHNPRSTVGTITEVYDYLRLLYARVGVPHCPSCGRLVERQTVQQIVDAVLGLPEGTRIMLLAPLIKDRKGEHRRVFTDIRRSGLVRARVDGEIRDVNEEISLERYKMHTIEAVVDRLIVAKAEDPDTGIDRARLADSVETALKLGAGVAKVVLEDGTEYLYSEHLACGYCGVSLPDLEPRSFSFNSPHGACPDCTGLGVLLEIDPELVIPDKALSLSGGAIEPSPWNLARSDDPDSYYWQLLQSVADHYGFTLDTPVQELAPEQLNVLFYGSGDEAIRLHYRNRYGHLREYETPFEGVVPNLRRRHHESNSDYMRAQIESYMSTHACPTCDGRRLKRESLAVTVAEKSIVAVADMSVAQAMLWVDSLPDVLAEREQKIARLVLKELKSRLKFMVDVGLDYLTLARTAVTLSGGEAQRIRLATQIGSQLMGVLYILDEPSVGLHQRDNRRLIETLMGMRDLGNTLIVVEHDQETICSADHIIDLGPGAGEEGGDVVVAGGLADVIACRASVTGQYLSGEKSVLVPKERRSGNGQLLEIVGAAENNLKHINVRIPLGRFVCVTGVSGSGKSSLIIEVLYKALSRRIHRSKDRPGAHEDIRGVEHLDKVIDIDQSPIGRTPRSNPATYTNVFTPIRELFASLPEAKMRGYRPGRFSFNVKGGRCEACRGDGTIKIEMQFLPDVYVTCEVCHGRRYNREALEIRFKGKNIADVLDLTVDEALRFFERIPRIHRKLQTLHDVGLGYIRLGQSATTLSGGEAQRIKLSKELSRRATGSTLYILDEPTTGLHFADIHRLLAVLNRLVDAGNTVVIIEHHPDVIKTADWIIDLGPEGGEEGGWVIAEGSPEQVAEMPQSYTGQLLARVLT
ncbi:MAG: excinuclease ABC subunit UvrA [Anaerolineales bacterium]|nr:MAG: excinuclease ABC subunit UvrA [Anaerolineales bacterium]